MIMADKMHVEGFVASNGWLESFKKAHNISTMTVAGEEVDVSITARDALFALVADRRSVLGEEIEKGGWRVVLTCLGLSETPFGFE